MANNVMNGSEKMTVKALYKFKASNNDEVSFKYQKYSFFLPLFIFKKKSKAEMTFNTEKCDPR